MVNWGIVSSDLLTAALSALAGPECACCAGQSEVVTEQLFPEERAYLVRAVRRRQAEFGTARVFARRALAKLGVPPQPLVPHADRSPKWPKGVVGSISHKSDQCAVVLSRERSFSSIGLDIEGAFAVNGDMRATICTPEEKRWLETRRMEDKRWLDTLLFSAKESFYKCQYVLTHRFLDFKDIELQFDFESASFQITGLSECVPQRARLQQIHGRWMRLPETIITLALLR